MTMTVTTPTGFMFAFVIVKCDIFHTHSSCTLRTGVSGILQSDLTFPSEKILEVSGNCGQGFSSSIKKYTPKKFQGAGKNSAYKNFLNFCKMPVKFPVLLVHHLMYQCFYRDIPVTCDGIQHSFITLADINVRPSILITS